MYVCGVYKQAFKCIGIELLIIQCEIFLLENDLEWIRIINDRNWKSLITRENERILLQHHDYIHVYDK